MHSQSRPGDATQICWSQRHSRQRHIFWTIMWCRLCEIRLKVDLNELEFTYTWWSWEYHVLGCFRILLVMPDSESTLWCWILFRLGDFRDSAELVVLDYVQTWCCQIQSKLAMWDSMLTYLTQSRFSEYWHDVDGLKVDLRMVDTMVLTRTRFSV
jgi:hypothetical protein